MRGRRARLDRGLLEVRAQWCRCSRHEVAVLAERIQLVDELAGRPVGELGSLQCIAGCGSRCWWPSGRKRRNNSFRELGGTLGIAVLGSVFSAAGSFASPAAFVDGLRPALIVGTVVLGLGAVAALLIPRGRPAGEFTERTVPTASPELVAA